MNILFLTPRLPYPLDHGAKIRMYWLMRGLAERHRITLIAFYQPEQDAENLKIFERFCEQVVVVPYPEPFRRKRRYQLISLLSRKSYHRVAFYSDEMQQAISSCTALRVFDIIQVEQAQMGFYDFPRGTRFILDQHNLEYEIFYRTYLRQSVSLRKIFNYMEWKKFGREELGICRRSSLCLTTSERDKGILRKHIPSLQCQVIPNGVDSLFFRDPGGHVEEGCIVFTGTISYFPNLDGVLYFVDKVFPLIKAEREHVKFYIVGKDPPEKIRSYASSTGIIVTGTVEDVRPYLSRAQVVVAPLRIGGGTRLKILEALAMGKAVVATSLAAEGLELVSDEHLVIANDPGAFARTVVDLLGDEKLRARLGANGRKAVEERYDWRSITQQLEAVQQAVYSRDGRCPMTGSEGA